MAMIREVGRGEGVALSLPDGRDVAVYLDEVLSPGRVRLRYVEGDVSDAHEFVEGDEGISLVLAGGQEVRVCVHEIRSGSRVRLRVHAPREVEIEFVDARFDEVGEER